MLWLPVTLLLLNLNFPHSDSKGCFYSNILGDNCVWQYTCICRFRFHNTDFLHIVQNFWFRSHLTTYLQCLPLAFCKLQWDFLITNYYLLTNDLWTDFSHMSWFFLLLFQSPIGILISFLISTFLAAPRGLVRQQYFGRIGVIPHSSHF